MGLVDDVQHELVAAIDDALALGPDLFRPPTYGPYVHWRDHTSAFVETVFGPVERQRFHEAYDPPPTTLSRNLEDRRKRLEDLRDRPQTWDLRVNAEGLRKACAARRERTIGEQIVEAGSRPVASPQGENMPDEWRPNKLARWWQSTTQWTNSNQGLLAAIGVLATVVGIVIAVLLA